jgi:organic hydroperoxide reductase OsmC/OhrA
MVRLHPMVRVEDAAKHELALALHHEAHAMCFIARSVRFPVEIVPQMLTG